jgi:hypothetical protein
VAAPLSTVATTTLTVGDGIDFVVVDDYIKQTTVALGNGDDTFELRVLNAKTGADSIEITSGTGDDAFDITSTGDHATTDIDAGDGDNTITIESVGAFANTDVDAGGGADIVRVEIANIPSSATTSLHGQAPSTSPGDELIVDPQDPNAVVFVDGVARAPVVFAPNAAVHTVKLAGKGLVSYDTFEGGEILSSPTVTFTQTVYDVNEGGLVILTVIVQPNDRNNDLSGPVAFDIDGDGQFGEVTGTNIGNNRYQVAIPWSRLVDFGLNNGSATGTDYTVSAKATNSDGLSSTAVATVRITDTPPDIKVSGSHTASVGTSYTLGFSASDFSPVDTITQWLVDWGDGTTSTYGFGTSSATHVYALPGVVGIVVNADDKDTDPNGTNSNPPFQVTIGTAPVGNGAPYTIREGQSLILTAPDAPGTPASYVWELNGKTSNEKTGQTVTYTWAELEALGINDGSAAGKSYAANLSVIYNQLNISSQVSVGSSFTITVDNAPPTFNSFTNSGTTPEGGNETVTINGASDPSAADVAQGLKFRYDFDNSGTFTALTSSSSVAVPVAFLREAGPVTVHAQIVDKDGGVTDAFTTFNVLEVPPTLIATGASGSLEGSTYTLALSENDPGNDIIKTWTVDWGDNTTSHFTVDPTAPNADTTATHVYADNGVYAIKVGAIDHDGSYSANGPSVTVLNVAPTLQNVAVAPTEIKENDSADVSGLIVDPGVHDSFTLSVNWGDGNTNTYSLAAGARNFDAGHQYLQDGNYQITTSVVDKDGGASTPVTVGLKVDDVAPVVTSLVTVPQQTTEGESVTVQGLYTDVGTLDTHTVTIDWGDGKVEHSTDTGTTIVIDPINRAFTATHLYVDNPNLATTPDSKFTITATVTDEAGVTSNPTSSKVEVDDVAPIFRTATLDGVTVSQSIAGSFPSTFKVDKGQVVTFAGSIVDPGIKDGETVAIDWGDGTTALAAVTTDPRDPTLHAFTATHTYLNQPPSGNAEDDFIVTATATDKDGGTNTLTTKLTVINVPPAVTLSISGTGVAMVLHGEVTHIGTFDDVIATITWGDGTSQTITVSPKAPTFDLPHAYPIDASAEGLTSTLYIIDVVVLDRTDALQGAAQTTFTVLTQHGAGAVAGAAQAPSTALADPALNTVGMGPAGAITGTTFTPGAVLGGGLRFEVVTADEGGPVDVPFRISEADAKDVSKVVIDWGDGREQTLANVHAGSFDVAHAYPTLEGDEGIVTGSVHALNPEGERPNGDSAIVVIKVFRKDADGNDVLAWVKRARVKGLHMGARIDKVTFDRSATPGGAVDTVSGEVAYRGASDGFALMVTWSDGTVSEAKLETRDGVLWFTAAHSYTGGAPASPIDLRAIDTTTAKALGSYAIRPGELHGANSNGAPAPRPAHHQRGGDASPVIGGPRSGLAAAHLSSPANAPVMLTDMALMFGAVMLGAGGARKLASPSAGRSSDHGRLCIDAMLAERLAGYGRAAVPARPAPPPSWRVPEDWNLAAPPSGQAVALARALGDNDDWVVLDRGGPTAVAAE